MKEVKITIIFVLALVIITPAVLSLGIRYLPDKEIPQAGQSLKIFEGNELEFDIEKPKKNLVGVGVVTKNPQRSSADLKFSIYDEEGNLQRESVVNGLSIPDGGMVKFVFPVLQGPVSYRTWRGVFSSNVNKKEAMEIYLEKNEDIPAFVSLYKPASRLSLIINIYSSWLKHSFSLK